MAKKLTYFDLNGLAESIRYILHYTGQKFEDVRIPIKGWPIPEIKDKLPFKQFPLYEEGDKVLHQSLAIARYVAANSELLPSDPWEQAVLDAAVLTYYDFDARSRELVKEPQIIILTGDWKPGKTTSDQNSAEIAMDYFYGEASLRTPKHMICKGNALKQECRTMCGANNYGCISNKCVCLDHLSTAKLKEGENLPPSKKELKMLFSDFEDLIEVLRRQSVHNIKPKKNERPALRHHIAHFCDLNVARKCIQKCMKLGKPAFCGKDHNCYCGHKYNSHSEDKKIDITDTYAQFRDLYTKYFGADGDKAVSLDEDDW